MIRSITGKSSWRTAPATTLEAAATHNNDNVRHITSAERTAWNNKETTAGAQAKADAAQSAAATDASTKANDVQANLTTHAGNTTAHITSAERSAWNAKADASQLGRVNLTQTLGLGTSVIQADQNGSELDLTVQGRTLVNLLGSYGDGESLTGFTTVGVPTTVSTTQRKSGVSSLKFAPSAASSAYVYRDMSVPLDATKYYVLAAWMYIESVTSPATPEVSLRDIGTFISRYSIFGSTTVIGNWQLRVVKIPTSNTLVGSGFRLLVGAGDKGASAFYIDDIRLYEVSAAEYAAIGTTIIGDVIDSYFPHVSGEQHVQGVAITKQGKTYSFL